MQSSAGGMTPNLPKTKLSSAILKFNGSALKLNGPALKLNDHRQTALTCEKMRQSCELPEHAGPEFPTARAVDRKGQRNLPAGDDADEFNAIAFRQ